MRYLQSLAAAFLLALVAAALLNFTVDPYRVFRGGVGDSGEPAKPRAGQQRALLKIYNITRTQPATLVLGNSRAEVGFDPRSPFWPEPMRPVFNAAVPGTSVATALKYLQHALAVGEVRHVLIGVDFPDFLTSPHGALPGSDWRAQPLSLTTWQKRVGDAVPALLTVDASLDSLATLARAGDPLPEDLTALGFNPMREYVGYARREGYGALFLQRDLENSRNYAARPKALFLANTRTSYTWRELARLVALCRDHGIEATFVVYPYHVHILELFRIHGLWPLFEEWKRHLVLTLEQEARASGTSPYRVFDFSGYHRYAREDVPPVGDRHAEVAWYWEAGHFKKELGEKILERVYAGGREDFGVELTSDTIEAHIVAIRRQAAEFSRDFPSRTAALARLATRAR